MSELPEGQFSFRCSNCSKKLRVKLKAIGRQLKCPNCGHEVTIPDPQAHPEHQAPPEQQGHAEQPRDPAQQPQPRGRDEAAPAADEPARSPRRPSLFDVDELVLEGPAIENLHERQQQSRAIQEARAAEHKRRLAAEQQRQMPLPDQAKRNVFDDDLPELVNVPDLQPASPSSAAEFELDKIVATLGKHAISLDLESLVPAVAPEVFEDKYRATCPTCGTIQYVAPASQGSKLKCPDCTSRFTVPAPPPNWKPSRVRTRHNKFDEQSPLAKDDELGQIDRQRKQQTQAMLDRAEVELSEEEEEGKLYGTDFDTPGFLRRTFGFALDPVAIGIIIGYSVVFAVVFAMLQFGLSSDGTAFGQGVMLFCGLTAPAIAIIFGMPMISAALAQLEAAANQQHRVTDWPSMNVFEHFGDVMAVTVALIAASIPGYLLGTWIGADLVFAGRLQITGVMFTTFLLFPVFYLSILDSGSILQLISVDVFRSIKEVGEAWGGFYLKTMIVFLSTLIVWYLLLGDGKSPFLGAMAGAMLPSLVFFTFHQLGLLADSIGEKLSPSLLPDSKKTDEGQVDEIESV